MVKATFMDAFKTVSSGITLRKKDKCSKSTPRELMEYPSEGDDATTKFFGAWCMDDCFATGSISASSTTAATSYISMVRSNDLSSDCSLPVDSPCRKMKSPISQYDGRCSDKMGRDLGGLAHFNNVQGPPEIKRDISVADLDCLDEFPSPSWQGDFILDFDMKMDLNGDGSFEYDANHKVSPPMSSVESMEYFQTAWSTDDDDNETVVISNRSGMDRSLLPSSQPETRIGTDQNESLLEIFQIKISSPLRLPKGKRGGRIKQFIRPLTTREKQRDRSITAAEIMQDSNMDTFWVRNASFNEAQENILLGVPLQTEKKQYRSPQRIGAMLKRSSSVVAGRDANPARKLKIILKKRHARKHSDPVQRIGQILSWTKGPHIEKPQRDRKSKLDEAVGGIFDGLDIISCGSARKVSYIGKAQKKLVGQRYTLRSMVLDSLWSESGSDPAEIKFEGFSQQGEGNDRWSCRIERWAYQRSQRQADIWGKGNNPPPSHETKSNKNPHIIKRSARKVREPKNLFAVRTLEQLKVAHDYAVAPLQCGHINESIVIFKKILRSLKVKYALCGGLNHVVASTCHNIALLYTWEGSFEDALNYINKAISIRVNAMGYDHSSVAVSLAKQGVIYFALENPESSLRSFNQALDILTKVGGEDNVQVSKLLNNVGVVYFHLGEKRKALDQLISALNIQKEWIEGSLSRECTIFDTSITLSNVAKIYLKKCEYTMAAYLYEEALQLQTTIFKKDHHVVLDTLGSVAYSKARAGEKTNALQIYKSLLELQCKKFGVESREASETKGLMGVLHVQQSNFTVALRYLTDVMKWQRIHLDHRHPALLNTRNAIEQLSFAVKGVTATLPPTSPLCEC